MTCSRGSICFRLAPWVLLTLASVGCGSSSSGIPEGSVSPTSNALVAQYSVTPSHVGSIGWVEFGRDTNYGRETSRTPATTNYGQTINIMVAGMKPSTTYHMRAHLEWPAGNESWVDQDRTFTTRSLASVGLVAPQITVTNPDPSLKPTPGVELIDGVLLSGPSNGLLTTVVTDLQGNVIWYYPPGQDIYRFTTDGYVILNLTTLLRETDLAGNIIQQVTASQVNRSLQLQGYSYQITGFHHDLLLLPNGHWIGLANILKDFTDLPGYPGVTTVLSDALLDIDPTGNVVWAWSAFDHLDINRHPWGLGISFAGAGGAMGADWTHGNALQYTADGNLLFSMRAQDWIIKIDYANGMGSGDILWHLGYQGDFTLAGGDSRDWFYGQHEPSIVSENGSQMTLSVWDNGNNRVQPDGSVCGTQPPCYSRATLFTLDENGKTADLLWQDLPNLYSVWGGAVEELGNGRFEFDMTAPFGNSASRVEEVTQTDNPQLVWQMDIKGQNAYRAYRMPSLYPGVTWKKVD